MKIEDASDYSSVFLSQFTIRMHSTKQAGKPGALIILPPAQAVRLTEYCNWCYDRNMPVVAIGSIMAFHSLEEAMMFKLVWEDGATNIK